MTASKSVLNAKVSKWVVSAALAGVATLAGTQSSFAGASASRPASCTFNADGSGFCSGSLTAFRHAGDASAQLILDSLLTSGGATRKVNVTFGGKNKVITVSAALPAATLAAFDGAAASATAHIYVHWTTSAQLDSFQLYNQSGLLP